MGIREPNPDGVKISDITGVIIRDKTTGRVVDNFPLPFVKGESTSGTSKRAPLESTAQLFGWIAHSKRLNRDRHYCNFGQRMEIVANVNGKRKTVAVAEPQLADSGDKRNLMVIRRFPSLT